MDQGKVSLIKTLLLPTTVKGIRSFLGYVGFYKRFIRDFLQNLQAIMKIVGKRCKINFDESCRSAFEEIKSKFVTAPIMAIPN